jgi:hypothetical protein
MRNLILALATTALFAAPAFAKSDNANSYGQNKVCLLTFSSAEARAAGTDIEVTKAQYLPLPAAQQLKTDPSLMAIAYYGFGELSAEAQASIDFYYPTGSSDPALGVTENSDTETLCQAFKDFAAQNADD